MKKTTLNTYRATANGDLTPELDVRDYYGALLQIEGNSDTATVEIYGGLGESTGTLYKLGAVCLTIGAPFTNRTPRDANCVYWIPPSGVLKLVISGFVAQEFDVTVMLFPKPWICPISA